MLKENIRAHIQIGEMPFYQDVNFVQILYFNLLLLPRPLSSPLLRRDGVHYYVQLDKLKQHGD